ncbi:MAG: hypothetical protein RIS47_508 [Bacteroidota bacterium]
MSERRVRVRFAPSPTGPLHMGGVRTALFNYLFAKKNGGDFLLRIEDTDQTRYVPGAEQYIIESLEWCGMQFDEGPGRGGECGPYRQSDRKPMYRQYAIELVATGNAYYAFDTPEELEAMRDRLKAENASVQQYNATTRGQMQNSFSLPADVVASKLAAGEPYVIRFAMPLAETVEMTDIVRGRVVVNTRELDDKVLFKSDGMPTYHLANVVDDHLMSISHVIRGEEWLPSMPLHVLLYRAFGWEATMPEFAHLALLLKPDGKGKLSKRDGDQLGFPVFPLQWTAPSGEVSKGYREEGYFKEAFINMISLLGWNPGTEQEIFSLEELGQAFDLTRVSKSGARFDLEKAKWFNQQYLRMQTDAQLAELFASDLLARGIERPMEVLLEIVKLTKERVTFVKDFWDQASFFFEAPVSYDEKVIKKRWKPGTSAMLNEVAGVLASLDAFDAHSAEEPVKALIEAKGYNMGQVMNCLRLALVGESKGPHLFDITAIIGKTETLARIARATANIAEA